MVPEPLVQQLKKKRWGSGDENVRTVPTFVTAHTFCVSGDTLVSYGCCLLNQGYFCAVFNYANEAELSKCSWYPKIIFGVTMHFS